MRAHRSTLSPGIKEFLSSYRNPIPGNSCFSFIGYLITACIYIYSKIYRDQADILFYIPVLVYVRSKTTISSET